MQTFVFHDKQKPTQSVFLLFVYFFHPELLRKLHPGYLKLTSQILSGAHYQFPQLQNKIRVVTLSNRDN